MEGKTVDMAGCPVPEKKLLRSLAAIVHATKTWPNDALTVQYTTALSVQ